MLAEREFLSRLKQKEIKEDQNWSKLGIRKRDNVNTPYSMTNSIKSEDFLNYNVNDIENPFRLNTSISDEFNKYKFVFKETISEVIEMGKKSDSEIAARVMDMAGAPSLFNPYFSVHIKGMAENTPLLNFADIMGSIPGNQNFTPKDLATSKKINDGKFTVNFSDSFEDTSDCTIANLVKLSKTVEGLKKVGGAGYRYADFMFCKDLGKISNNHLITLRRFQHPIGDNIWEGIKTDENNDPHPINVPDIGRLVTWFNEDNKLEDIINYSFHATWKEVSAKIQSLQSQEDSPERGIMGSLVNMMDPQYASMVAGGFVGSGNKVLNDISNSINTSIFPMTDSKGQYEGSEILGNYDNNRIYTPQNSIWDTHLYEGQLKFNQEFKLVFNYELRAYENINPKAAFLDLIGNIQEVTFRHGQFWGGEQKIVGYRGNRAGWKKAQNLVDKGFDKLGGFFDSILNGNADWGQIWGSISDAIGGIMKGAGEMANKITGGQGGPTADKAREKTVEIAKKFNLSTHLKGMMQNKLGRPAMYAFDSLLSGDPVGLWHLTLGNPLNPIMSIGNLIITDANIQQYGPLGIDDFPTGLKVTVSLKHARGRDITGITQMYTQGKSAIYMPLALKKIEKYYNFGNIEKDTEANKILYKGWDGKATDTPVNSQFIINGNEGNDAVSIFGTNDARQIIFNFANK